MLLNVSLNQKTFMNLKDSGKENSFSRIPYIFVQISFHHLKTIDHNWFIGYKINYRLILAISPAQAIFQSILVRSVIECIKHPIYKEDTERPNCWFLWLTHMDVLDVHVHVMDVLG